jgi:L-amino acid N-acyltransferase YncA
MVYRTLTLKNGKTATLEWLKEKDLPEVVRALNSVIIENRYLLNTEIVDMQEERKWFTRNQKQGMLYLIARVDTRVIGGASLLPQKHKSAHVAEYGIFICKNYRNQGLGTKLTKIFVEIAKKKGFEIIQLSVYATNNRAFNVYKKCGFRECGRYTNDIKFTNGTFTDRILMELLLK